MLRRARHAITFVNGDLTTAPVANDSYRTPVPTREVSVTYERAGSRAESWRDTAKVEDSQAAPAP
jgi:hypothetical protein